MTLNLNKVKIYKRKDGFGQLSYGGKIQCRKIFHLMYDDSNIKMERKYNKAKENLFEIV